MAYTPPPSRSLALLEGTNCYPTAGTILDLSPYVKTAVPAGSNGRIIKTVGCVDAAHPSADGRTLSEAGSPTVPIRLVGYNIPIDQTHGSLTQANVDAFILKAKSRGVNYVRFILESYLTNGGTGDTATLLRGDSTLSHDWWGPTANPGRWLEVDYFISQLRLHGIYYTISIASKNMGIDTGTTNRWDATVKNAGTAVATVSGGGGIITSVGSIVGATGYFFPPICYAKVETGSTGQGAVFRTTIDGPSGALIPGGGGATYAGTVQTITIENGGSDYAASTNLLFYGNNNSCHARLQVDLNVQDEYRRLCHTLYDHVNTYTGIAYKDDPAMAFVETFNEVEPFFNFVLQGGVTSNLAYLRSSYWQFLKDKYATPLALRTAYEYRSGGGTAAAYVRFVDVPIGNILSNSSQSTLACQSEKDTYAWQSKMGRELYARMKTYIKDVIGYTGLIASNDTPTYPGSQYVNQNPDANEIQDIHAYWSTNEDVSTQAVGQNGVFPTNLPTFPYQSFTLNNGTGPKVITETNSPMPYRYRGAHAGITAGIAASNDYSLIAHHYSAVAFNTFSQSNPRRGKSATALNVDLDPTRLASVYIGSLMFLRGDVTVIPIARTLEVNEHGLNINGIGSMPTIGTDEPHLPVSTAALIYGGTYSANAKYSRHELHWNDGADTTIGTAYRAAMVAAPATRLTDLGFGITTTQYAWNVTYKNYYDGPPYDGLRVNYSANNELFEDGIVGLVGQNTARTQGGVAGFVYALSDGSHCVKDDGSYDTTRLIDGSRDSRSFYKNFLGNRFWTNLRIHNIHDGGLLYVTSNNTNSISTTNSMVIAFAGDHKNTGVTFISSGNTTNTAEAAPKNMTAAGITFTGSVSGNILTATTAPAEPGLWPGQPLYGTGVTGGTNIVSQLPLTGGESLGGIGRYVLDDSMSAGSTTITTCGRPTFQGTTQNLVVTPVLKGSTLDAALSSLKVINSGAANPSTSFVTRKKGPSFVAITGATATGQVASGVVDAPERENKVGVNTAITLEASTGGWPLLATYCHADFTIDGIDGTKNWTVYELALTGERKSIIPYESKTATSIRIILDSAKTVLPTVFYELSY